MIPFPETSHILKTCPTNAGPPPFPEVFRPPILTSFGNAEPDSGDSPFVADAELD